MTGIQQAIAVKKAKKMQHEVNEAMVEAMAMRVAMAQPLKKTRM